jgi:hypothetical protein
MFMQVSAMATYAAESASPVEQTTRAVPCPTCGSRRVHRSHRRKPVDWALTLVGGRLHCCFACDTRFASFWSSTFRIRDAQRLCRRLVTFGLILAAAVFVALALMYLGAHFTATSMLEPGS